MRYPYDDIMACCMGGTFNLHNRMPYDAEGQVVSGSVSLNYGDFIEETDPSASILYSNRWDTNAGEFGLLLNYAYSEISTRTDGIFLRTYFARTDIIEAKTVWFRRGADRCLLVVNRVREGW